MCEPICDLLRYSVLDAVADMDERVKDPSEKAVEHRRLYLALSKVGVEVVSGREDVFVQNIRWR